MPALDNEPAVHLTLGNLKELTNVLQAIKSAAKQVGVDVPGATGQHIADHQMGHVLLHRSAAWWWLLMDCPSAGRTMQNRYRHRFT